MLNVERFKLNKFKHRVHHNSVAENGNYGSESDGCAEEAARYEHHEEDDIVDGSDGNFVKFLAEGEHQSVP